MTDHAELSEGTDDANEGIVVNPVPMPPPVPPTPVPPPVPPTPLPVPPSSTGTALTVHSVSGTGFLAAGATTLTDTWGTQTVSTTAIGSALTATSNSVTVNGANGTVDANQTVTGSWTSALTSTATFADSWTSTGVTGVNANINFGLGAPSSYASAVFNVTLGTAGSYDVNWSAVLGGSLTFGLQNIAISVDGGPIVYSPTQPTATVSPTGDYVGALTAGTHSIALYDNSNFTGFPAKGTGTLTEKLNLTVSPSTTSVIGVNGLALSAMTFVSPLTTAGQTLTSQAGGLDLFAGAAAAVTGDTFANLLTNDIIQITDLAFAGLGMVVTQSGANTVVTLAGHSTVGGTALTASFNVAGNFSQSSFHLASDGANGILIAHS